MTPRERVIAALEHRQPDLTPWHVTFTEPARAAMAAYWRDPDFETRLGNCLLPLRTRLPDRDVPGRPGGQVDEFGVEWDRSVDRDIGTVCNVPVTRENLAAYRFPDPAAAERFARFPAAIAANRGERFLIATVAFTMFERAWTLAGMENVLAAMAGDKPFANALFDRILEHQAAVTRAALAWDVDGVRFGDDWCQQQGLLMGPALWRELIKPRVAALYRMVKARGKRVFIHSCGNLTEILSDLVEIGVDVLNPFQPEVMDVETLQQ